MKRSAIPLVFLLGSSFMLHAESKPNEQLAREFYLAELEVTDSAMSAELVNSILKSTPQLISKSDIITSFFMEMIHSKDLEEVIVPYYAETFTESELRDLTTMVKSDTFKLYKVKTTAAVSKRNEELEKILQKNISELQRRLKGR